MWPLLLQLTQHICLSLTLAGGQSFSQSGDLAQARLRWVNVVYLTEMVDGMVYLNNSNNNGLAESSNARS